MLFSLQKYLNTNKCVLYSYLCTICTRNSALLLHICCYLGLLFTYTCTISILVYHNHICVLFAQAILPYCYTSAVIWVLVTFILLDLAKAFVNALFITEILEYQYLCTISILVYYIHTCVP